MKSLLSTRYSATAFNIAIFVLRVGAGILMLHHGYSKLIHFGTMQHTFLNFFGIGSPLSLALDLFAEFFCAIFLVLGLFTRLVTIPLIIAMAVALVMGHQGDIFGKGEAATLFLIAFIVLLLVGPGKASIDGMAGK